jgi:hypothetical protein
MEVVMNRVPRASFCITLLGDEDFGVLMARDDGPEVFGIFVAMVLAARERLQQGKASRLKKTDALRFENGTPYVVTIARVSAERFTRCLAALAEVAEETGGMPWMTLDESGHVVIRSFFKFNTYTGWGGTRPGAGRPPDNQDEIKLDSSRNQDDSKMESSARSSGSGSGSGSGLGSKDPQTPTGGERAGLTSEDPETLSVCRWANDLVTGWGPLAEGACKNYPAAWVREACSIAREAKASRWKFVDSILGRFKAQGGPDSARASPAPRNTIAEKLGGGTLAERKARTKAIFEDLDRRNGVA